MCIEGISTDSEDLEIRDRPHFFSHHWNGRVVTVKDTIRQYGLLEKNISSSRASIQQNTDLEKQIFFFSNSIFTKFGTKLLSNSISSVQPLQTQSEIYPIAMQTNRVIMAKWPGLGNFLIGAAEVIIGTIANATGMKGAGNFLVQDGMSRMFGATAENLDANLQAQQEEQKRKEEKLPQEQQVPL